MTSWPIFHGLLTSDFDQFSMVKIFVIGRVLHVSSVDGSKLIFYKMHYHCETSRVCCHSKGTCFGGGASGQYLGHRTLCLMAWRLVDGLILYLGCWFCVTQTLTWIYVCMSVTYISWSGDFALYFEDYLLDKCHNWDIGSMWCKDLPH